MIVADFILERLACAGIDTAFYVYGGAISPLMDAFTRQTRIKAIGCHHEQGAGFMAEGYAKAKGVPGLCVVTSGPGVGNIVTAIQNCYYDSVPCVFLTGQVSTKLMRPSVRLRQKGFQETPAVDILSPIVKYAHTADSPALAVACLGMALERCMSGRRGPVVIDLPIDVQREQMPQMLTVGGGLMPDTVPCITQAKGFIHDLSKAKRPAILVGGGAYASRASIMAFAEKNGIPVFRTWNALDVVTDDSDVYAGTVGTYGGPGRNFGVANADLLLVLGCRMSGRILGGMSETFARKAKIYRVDIDAGLLDERLQERVCDVNVRVDCGEFIRAMA